MSLHWTSADFPPSEGLLHDWHELRDRKCITHIQSSPWWLEIWWRHFGPAFESEKAWLELLYKGDELLAVLPMFIRKEREAHVPLARRILGALGGGFGDTVSLQPEVDDDEILDAIAAHLDSMRDSCDEIRISPLMPEGSGLPGRLADAGWDCERIEGNPRLSLEPGWDELKTRVGKNLRRDVAKKKRRLEEQNLFPRLALEREASLELLEELRKLAQLRFEAEQHKSAFLDDVKFACILEVALEASRRGCFACYLYHAGERLIGYRFGFQHKGIFYDWITSYDPAFFQWSVGKLLLWDIVESLCEQGAEGIDFMAGEEDYKLKWLPEIKDMWRCRYRKSSVANKALKAVQVLSKLKRDSK